MQTQLKEEIDADLHENYVSITDNMTSRNRYEINCGECNKTFYADKETSEKIYRSMEQGLDNSFLCTDCQREYDELAYENR